MGISGIGELDYLAMYGMRETVGSVAEKSFADEISKAAARLETDSDKAVTKMRHMRDDIGETSELEDKYCSLCGSMIKEDGSCPLCGVPTFISGNGCYGRSGN